VDENNIIAAILTVAYNSAYTRDASDTKDVVRTYETFQKLLQERGKQEVPGRIRAVLDDVRKKQDARQKPAS
jgi:hypothetical protein